VRNLSLKQYTILSAALLLLVGAIVVAGFITAGVRVDEIRDAWTSLQSTRPERARIESSLRSALGYGGMIHNFKNLVLRKESRYLESTQEKLGLARAAIVQYRGLDIDRDEKVALDAIIETLDSYEASILNVGLMAMQRASAVEIDENALVDDGPALRGLDEIRKAALRHHLGQAGDGNKAILVARLRSALGYGGMIHAFKDFVLRRDMREKENAERKIAEVLDIIAAFKRLGATETEDGALDALEKTVLRYRKELHTTIVLMAADRSVENIDLAVRVDDGPALTALMTLDREIARQAALRTREVEDALNFVERIGIAIVIGTSLLILVLLTVSVSALQTIVIKPVRTMTRVMSNLASGDFATEIPGTDMSNEIGEMARATAVFREASIQRMEADRQLADAHGMITESVQYASRIQQSLLPPPNALDGPVSDHFIVWQPKDVVGGDLYWVKQDKKGCMIVAFDCTGHGVPGALMTTIAVSAIDHAFDETGDPARLIRQVHQRVKTALNQDSDEGLSDDGLEMGACLVESKRGRLTFAGARFELLISHRGTIDAVKGDKAGVGYRRFPMDQKFNNHVIKLEPGMTFFMFTDGITDQIGGEKRRMFGKNRLKKTLLGSQGYPLAEQGERLLETFQSYQDEENRRDDLTVIGFQPLA